MEATAEYTWEAPKGLRTDYVSDDDYSSLLVEIYSWTDLNSASRFDNGGRARDATQTVPAYKSQIISIPVWGTERAAETQPS